MLSRHILQIKVALFKSGRDDCERKTHRNILAVFWIFPLVRVHFVAVGVCLTISQNSYEVFQVLSLSILSFPREMSLLLAHYFADITLCVQLNFPSQHPLVPVHHDFHLLFPNLLQFQMFIVFLMNNA